MPKKPYKLSDKDIEIAWEYLRRKLHIDTMWPQVGKNHAAKSDFISRSKDPSDIQQWCEKWLTDRHWLRLKRSIWATQKRIRDKKFNEKQPTYAMSKKAWVVLFSEAEKKNTTVTDLVLETFGKKHLKKSKKS